MLQDRLWSDAAASASERRAQVAGLRPQDTWEGVLIWERIPQAGSTAVALYNRESGALR